MLFNNNSKLFYMFRLLISFLPFYTYFFLLKFNMVYIAINNRSLLFVSSFLKEHISFKFDRLIELIACDNLLKEQFRFDLTYIFYSTVYSCRLALKLFTNDFVSSSPIFSLSSVFSSAGWLEREVWDMFGIRFLFHKELVRILSDYGFKGNPLRKDFPLYGYIDLYYSNINNKCILSPVILSQMFRNYVFENPWLLWQN